MSDELILRQASPTLAGLKTGSLFTVPYRSEAELRADVAEMNRRLAPKGVSLRVLRMRRRALLGIGKCDYGDPSELLCCEPGAEVLGASSDHTILDIEDCPRDLRVGDIVEFDLKYATIVYLTNSDNIEKVYI